MSKRDSITVLGKGSVVQHGKYNDRVYLMKIGAEESVGELLRKISRLANKYNYSKLFCKVPAYAAPSFLADGYILEGYIPKFYQGEGDAFFLSKFLKSERLYDFPRIELSELDDLLRMKLSPRAFFFENEFQVRRLEEKHAPLIAGLYAEIFETYPFPIYDPDYIVETMGENIQYYGAFRNGALAALSSSEIDFDAMNAEMTDFATRKVFAGHNLSCLLLKEMEEEMRKQGIKTLYTIARLKSVPMNKTFLRFGYKYAGTLINNTNIAGKVESMNLYYKHLDAV